MAFSTIGEFKFPPNPVTQLTEQTRVNVTRSYKILIECEPEYPQNLFSYLRIHPILYTRNGAFSYFDYDYLINPLKSPHNILIPLSRHYIGFINMALEIKRTSNKHYSGEQGDLKVTCYIESRTFATWR